MKHTRPHDQAREDLTQPDDARTLVWSRHGRIRLAVLGSSAVLVAAAIAGCGGNDAQTANANAQANQGQSGQGRPQLSADQQDQLKKFRDCMKKNGVDLPDLGNGGPPQGGGPPAGVDPSSSKFRSAIQKCGQYAPSGGPPGGQGGPPGMGGPPTGAGGPRSGQSGQGGDFAPGGSY